MLETSLSPWVACSSNSEVYLRSFCVSFPRKVYLYVHQIQKDLLEFFKKDSFYKNYQNSASPTPFTSFVRSRIESRERKIQIVLQFGV